MSRGQVCLGDVMCAALGYKLQIKLVIFQTPHRPYRAVPLRYWQSDNRTSAVVLLATQTGNLARPHSRSPQALRWPGGPAMQCHLHRGDWSFHLTNEKKKKKLAISPGHSTPGQPVLSHTQKHQGSGRISTRAAMLTLDSLASDHSALWSVLR